MSTPSKLRVLCLHGYRQSSEKLGVAIDVYREMFKSSVDFVCVDAPIVVPYRPTADEQAARLKQQEETGDVPEDVRQFSWWNYKQDPSDGTYTFANFSESIDYLAGICKEQGPFDGVFGFSQGGMMAWALLQLQQSKKDDYPFGFSFGIFVASAPSTDESYIYCRDKLAFPSLHIMGTADAILSVADSRGLSDKFENPNVIEHAGGHCIPTEEESKDGLCAFVKGMQLLMLKRESNA